MLFCANPYEKVGCEGCGGRGSSAWVSGPCTGVRSLSDRSQGTHEMGIRRRLQLESDTFYCTIKTCGHINMLIWVVHGDGDPLTITWK